MLKIKAYPCKGKDLRPGDLFSTAGNEYWNIFELNHAIGERVYIRTETPPQIDDQDTQVFRIEILKDENDLSFKN